MVKEVLPEAKKAFEQYLKERTGKDTDITLEVSSAALVKGECEIGGVILYCNNNKIVFTNTIDSRLDLGLQENIPAIRQNLFG